MSQDTREKILDAGAELIHKKGYNHTGIQQILNAAGVPKGSFYFYFKSKEDFGLQLIDHFAHIFQQMAGPLLQDQSLSPLQKIEAFFELYSDFFSRNGYERGCPIGNLAQELGDLSEPLREKLEGATQALIGVFITLLRSAKEQGELSRDLNIEDTAQFIVSSWHGALVHMKVLKNGRPLLNHRNVVLRDVLGVQG